MSLAGIIAGLAAMFSQQVDSSAAASPALTPPASPWRIESGSESCLALRTYGSGNEALTLVLDRGARPTAITLGVIGRRVSAQPSQGAFSIQIGDNAALAGTASRMTPLANRQQMARIEFGWADVEASLRTAASVRINLARGPDRHLQLSDMAAMLDQLTTCHDRLLEGWGINLVALRALRTPPVPIQPEGWILTRELPYFAGTAIAAVLLSIDTEGAVTNCRTLDSSGLATVDQNICSQLRQRARFTPAIGPDGTPVPAQLVRVIQYLSQR